MHADLKQAVVADRTQYLGVNVLEAALQRLARAAQMYDNIAVLLSGGKDSQLVLELTRIVYDRLGRQDKPVRFLFNDQEFLEDPIIDTVARYMDDPRFEGIWLAAPQFDYLTVMQERRKVILWDQEREADWGRVPPEYALRAVPDAPAEPFRREDQFKVLVHTMYAHWGLKGSLAIANAHRFGENPTIRRMILAADPNRCWISKEADGMKGVDFVRPIYDWSVKDVFKFFYDSGIPYCAAYDINMHAGGVLRAGTPPLDKGQGGGSLFLLRESYPTLFTQVTRVWPELLTQERYSTEVDYEQIARQYGGTFEGMTRYIIEHVTDPENRRDAVKAVRTARRRRETARMRGKHPAPCYGVPLLHIWRALVRGEYRQEIKEGVATKRQEDFEREIGDQP